MTGSLTKSQKPVRSWDMEETDFRPEYRSISCELRALARMVQDEFGTNDTNKGGIGKSLCANSSPLFERGRFYEEYAARRNERLKRKKSEACSGEKTPYNLGVTVESAKRRDSKKLESLRKSVTAAYSVERNEPRYMLRSMSKGNKKPPLPLNSSAMATTEKKTVSRRARKI